MTANYSMQLSEEIKNLIAGDITGLLKEYYPVEKIRKQVKTPGHRDRVYNDETTLMTMVLSSVLEDKSLQNSVNIYQEIHKNNIEKIELRTKEFLDKEREEDSKIEKKQEGQSTTNHK